MCCKVKEFNLSPTQYNWNINILVKFCSGAITIVLTCIPSTLQEINYYCIWGIVLLFAASNRMAPEFSHAYNKNMLIEHAIDVRSNIQGFPHKCTRATYPAYGKLLFGISQSLNRPNRGNGLYFWVQLHWRHMISLPQIKYCIFHCYDIIQCKCLLSILEDIRNNSQRKITSRRRFYFFIF